MNGIRINEQIAFLRREKGITQGIMIMNPEMSSCRKSRISSGFPWMNCWVILRTMDWNPCAWR